MVMNLEKINFDRACRSCLVEEGEMENVFSDSEKSQLSHKIITCMRIEVHENDGLPKQICTKCSLKITQAYDFKIQFEKSHIKLREYLAFASKKSTFVKQENSLNDIIDFNSLYNTEINVKPEIIDNTSLEFHEIPNLPITVNNSLQTNINNSEGLSNNLDTNEKCTQTEEIYLINQNNVYCCEYCDKKFSSIEGLELHNKKHENSISTHACLHCDKIYVRKYHLQRHMKEVHGLKSREQRFCCKVCNTTLTRLEHLKRHMLLHVKNKPFNCDKCNMGFIRNENFLRHVESCQGAKDFTCGICHKGFDRQEQLLTHVKLHDNPRNMQCLDSLDSETFFENAEMVFTEPDINVMDHLELKQEADNETNDGDDFEVDLFEDSSTQILANKNKISHDSTGGEDSSDMEFSPYKKKTKKKKKSASKITIPGRKRGRPRKNPLPEIDTENSVLGTVNKHKHELNNIGIKEEINDEMKIKIENDDSSTGNEMDLKINKREHAEDKHHKCPVCEKTFTRSNHMKRHQLIHSSIKPYKCHVCAKGFNRLDHLNIHMFNHADKKPYECDICNKGFNKKDHLNKHKETKHGEKMSTPKTEFCEICKKGFTTPKYLQVHMKNHMEGKTYTCKFCSTTFNAKPELVEHLKTHSNEKPFLCSECGQRFIRNDYLVIHMRRHKGEKPYKCRYCGKGFPRATDLTVHERYHTGEKTHLCTICGKGFQRAYNLVVHTRVHTGEKPYVCSHCGKAFAQGNDLKAHVRRHTGERYNCEICGEGFIQGYHLTQHKRAAHGIDTPSNIRRVEKLPFPLIPPPSTGPRKRSRNQKLTINDSTEIAQTLETNSQVSSQSQNIDLGLTATSNISANDMNSSTNAQITNTHNNILADGLLQALSTSHINSEIDLNNRHVPGLLPILPLALFPTMQNR